jgi:hypothetical protein
MAITNGYATLGELKASLRLQDALDDDLLSLAIESASREVDGYCERVFYSTSATRVYAPTNVFTVTTDDIISVTTLKSSSDGVTYDITWETSDYQLEPLNNVAGGLVGSPFTRIRATGDYLMPTFSVGTFYEGEALLEVTGVFGWSAVPAAIRQATVILAMRLFKRLDAPLGMISNDLGSMRVGRFDPDVEALVAPFRKVSAG